MAPNLLLVDDNPELLTLLAQLLENAGYHVSTAGKGKQALDVARTNRPSLAILDLLLPDMMGYHLAEQLRREYPDLPLLFMTGVFKGGRHALEAKQKYGSAGYFEKPFEAQKLIEAAHKLVQPEKVSPPAASTEDAFEVELDIDVEEDQPQDAMELTGRIKVTGGGNLSAEIRGENLTASPMAKGEAQGMRPPPRDQAASPPVTMGPRGGELKDNLPALMTAFYLSKETGELGVQRGKVKKVIYFEKGTPVFALSNLAQDRFGQFLVRVGKIAANQLQDAASVAAAGKRRTGDVLVERGLLKDTERLYYIGQQVKSIIYSLFGWEDARYLMSFKDSARQESIKLDVHPANLIMRGVKKLYKPDRLKRLVLPEDRLIPSLQPSYALNEVDLEKWEAELLPKVDGSRTSAELVAIAQRPDHVVNAFLCGLLSLNILEKRT